MFLSIEVFVTACVVNSAKYFVKGYIIKTLITLWLFSQQVYYFTCVLQTYQTFKKCKNPNFDQDLHKTQNARACHI